MNNIFAKEHEASRDLQQLCELLELAPTNTTMHEIVQAIEEVSPGKCHRKYEWLKETASERDALYFRQKITNELRKRNRRLDAHSLDAAV